MKYTFFLKNPDSEKNTLILFNCYFKYEGKRFKYSTGETINPKNWNFENKFPELKKKNKIDSFSSIPIQLGRYIACFEKTEAICIKTNEDFTSKILKSAFDDEFKRVSTEKNLFFDAFKQFIDLNTKKTNWSKATIKRYNNTKNLLENFQTKRKYKLTFNRINSIFDAEFADYCLNDLEHINNTYSRNLGFLKTFLYWAVEEGYTYNVDFKKFKRKDVVVAKQIALELKDLEHLMQFNLKTNSLERIRDVFVFSCVTGLRFGELKHVKKENVKNGNIELKEEKDSSKIERNIPLMALSNYILKKYNYNLPLIANQKHNEYIKEVFKEVGYTQKIEKTITRGKEVIRTTVPFYERISSHTARRTFITMMKTKGKSDKLISKITGHKDLKTLNIYYQVEDSAKTEAVKDTFEFDFMPKLKKA